AGSGHMDPDFLYRWALIGLAAFGAFSFATLFFVPAPYGRHQRGGWGPTVPTRLAWIAQELPAPLVFALVFARGEHADRLVPLLLLGLWQLHYLQRTFVFPLLMRVGAKRTPLVTALLAFVFNCVNGAANAYAITHGALRHTEAWLADPRFAIGALLFLGGWALNLHSDAILRRLRAPGETRYEIPRGGAYRLVSCPNYLGEIVEWCGWALATWTYAGAVFAFFTFANLFPRALAHHRWYRERFPDYPRERKAVIPFVV
nr:Chain A, 3-oxo-5-alpha-steroid 4-dehydrogenase [Pseudomonadota bacterium]